MLNEKRLIDANELLKKATNVFDGQRYCCAVMTGDIYTAPTVDAVEVVHGRWIHHHCLLKDVYICSICHKFQLAKSNYCPNCSAKMDGGNEDV